MSSQQKPLIYSCLAGAVLFLSFYLLFTMMCNKKDNFEIDSSTGTINNLYNKIYRNAVPHIGNSFEVIAPKTMNESGTIQEQATMEGLDFYDLAHNQPSRIEKSLIYEDLVNTNYVKQQLCQ